MNINFWDITKQPGQQEGEPHDGQRHVLMHRKRFSVIVCGRRFGKTVMALVVLLISALSKPNSLYWYIAPTYKQARTIAWRLLMRAVNLFPKSYRSRIIIEKNDLAVEFPNGGRIELKGAQDPDSLVGSGLDGVVLDEYAKDIYGTSPVWEEAISPALADKMGWAIFISTPNGYNHFYELYDYAMSGKDPDWIAFRMPTSTNPWIPKKELENARRRSGEFIFAQEYEAQFNKRSGLVYKEFDRQIHVIDPKDPSEIPNAWSLEIGLDFGSDHPTAGLFVVFDHVTDTAYVVDEHYKSEYTTPQNVAAMQAIENKWLAGMRQPIPRVRWGDSQAKQSILDYYTAGYVLTPTIKGAESVKHGIDMVAERLRTDRITGKPKLFVCRNCVNTIREFENYVWAGRENAAEEISEMMRLANKSSKDAPKKVFDDAMDALRYVIMYHVPKGTQITRRDNNQRARNPITGR